MTTVTLYTRDGCCLCDQVRDVLIQLRQRHSFDLTERDIEADEELLREYMERIPVVEIDGIEAFELVIDKAELEQTLARVGQA
jgi:glutaredoxin